MDDEELHIAVRRAAFAIFIKRHEEETRKRISAIADIAEDMLEGLNNSSVRKKPELTNIVELVVQTTKKAKFEVDKIFTKHMEAKEMYDKERSTAVDVAIKEMCNSLYSMKDVGERLVKGASKNG